jgi:hypothetical protein
VFEDADLQGMVDLLNCKTKRDLEKYCRSFVLKSHDFALAIRIAMIGGFDPYQYASSFRQWSPDHLALEERDLKALSVNGIGPFTPAAKKTANKIFQMLEDRRMLADHLLYTLDHDYWFLFYFDQRDTANPNRQWKHGPHIHLISHHWPGLRLDDVWRQVQERRANFANKIHLRYQRPPDPKGEA